jgi:hypothetical protein
VIDGLSFFNSRLEEAANNKKRNLQRIYNLGDNKGVVLRNALGSRGNIDPNSGIDFADQKVPVQYGARPIAQAGGFFDKNTIPGYFDMKVAKVPEPFGNLTPSVDSGFDASNQSLNDLRSLPGLSSWSDPFGDAESSLAPDLSHKPNQAAIDAFNYYVQNEKLPPHIAAGIVGNIFQESSGNPKAENKIGAFGLAQWLGERKQAFLKYAKDNKLNPFDPKVQLKYILIEPGWGDKVMKMLRRPSIRTATEAAIKFADEFERMGKDEAAYDVRAGVAENLMDYYRKQYNSSKYQEGGEYFVSPKQLEFIMAHGGEVEFL